VIRLVSILISVSLLTPAAALAEPGMQRTQLPLSKIFDHPIFSLEGTHVELFSLLFLFLATTLVMAVRRRRQLVRHIIQLISLFVFFYVVFSCLGVFGMIRNTIHGISLIGTVHTESFFWVSLPVCVLAFSLTSGPFFCGWICPTGTVQELFTMLREWVTRHRPPRPTPRNLILLAVFFFGFLYLVFTIGAERRLFVEDSSLYWAASTILVSFLVLTGLADDVTSRKLRWLSFLSIVVSTVFKTIITSPVHFAFVDVFDPASAITTLVLAVSSIFVGRAWCRYVCPWGQMMSIMHRYSRIKVVVSAADCNSCGACVRSCRVGAVEIGRVRTEHCQLCFACVDACPNGGIEVVDTWLAPARPEVPAPAASSEGPR
jgi:polyferredoxin